MKNILVLTIDALSKWYIDNSAGSAPYLNSVSYKSAVSYNHVFSEGPFTEAAISGCWYGRHSLEGWNYLVENDYSNTSIFELFKQYYKEIYIGKLVPFYSRHFYETNDSNRENPVARAFEHVWRGRLRYYCELETDSFYDSDYLSIERILDAFFRDYYVFSEEVAEEKNEYEKNKMEYIQNILVEKEMSRFFQNLDSSMYYLDSEKGYVELNNRKYCPLSEKEILLSDKIRLLNRLRMCEINDWLYSKSELADVLEAPTNRCVVSNDNVGSMFRNGYEVLPKLGEELADFLEWYDGREVNSSFFGYIHNYDFHFPEDFLENRYEKNEKEYTSEIDSLFESLSFMPICSMSVSKQLTIRKIDALIKKFVEALEERHFFDDSVFVLTADHGITNFMYPVRRKKEERWNYLATNFNVPLYIFDGVKHGNDEALYSAKIIPDLLFSISQGQDYEGEKKDCLICSWINGVPDFKRNDIRFGYRTLRECVTIKLAYSQFIISAKVLGIYDITSDSDEINNLSGLCAKEKKKEILGYFYNEWERIVKEYLLGEGECAIYKSNNANCIRSEWEYICKFNRIIEYVDKKSFFESHSDIILCGEKKNLEIFICELSHDVRVSEIWMIEGNESYMLGLPCFRIGERDNQDKTIIVASKAEIDCVALLHSKGYKNVILAAQLI